jgi:hypothetical protein
MVTAVADHIKEYRDEALGLTMPLPNSIDAKVRLGCPRRQAAQVSPAAASTPTSLAYSRNDVTPGYGTTG